jgi:penicillin-binding protein 2
MLKSSNRFSSASSFKDHYQERKLLISRSIIAFVFVFVMLCSLLTRAWYLQVIKHDDYQTRSNNNRISVQPIAPKRGLIYDRNGILLADNRSVYSLEIIPEQVKDINHTLQRLIEIGIIEDKHREKFLDDLRGQRRFKSIAVKTRLNEQEVARFSVDSYQFPGVKVEARLVRHYPFAEIVVHALGRVGRINDRELARIDQANYKATRHIGKVGLEKYYEDILHGTIGLRRVETDVQGRVIGKPLFEKPPVPGKNIRLSLDIRMQKIATDAMEDARGSVVAIDPRNGEVLALVSNPGYDPNKFVTGISTVDYRAISTSKERPLFNRALRGLYSPGSTIKPHIGWVGLENHLITPKTTISDPGYWILPNKEERRYRDHKKGGHGNKVDLLMAITKSCDPYFYDLAYRMGIDTLSENMAKFGFGQYTGIDMGEEVPGIMPSRDWKRKNRKAPWFPGETVITGIGQGYWNATPLQFASSIGQLGGGYARYQLRLVNQVQDEIKWTKIDPVIVENQPDFSNQKNLTAVQEAMHKVTQYGGTAFAAFQHASYQSGGKTGTVQLTAMAEDEEYDETKIEKRFRDNAVYVGYAPFERPEIAIAVVVENAGHGGAEAAPIARKIFDEYFNNKVMAATAQLLENKTTGNKMAENN